MNEPTLYQQWCAALIEAHARYAKHQFPLLAIEEYRRWLVSHIQRQHGIGRQQIRHESASQNSRACSGSRKT
jgi:hypothetical protein